MKITIRDIAACYNITPQAVYKRLKSRNLSIKTISDPKTGLLTSEGEALLRAILDDVSTPSTTVDNKTTRLVDSVATVDNDIATNTNSKANAPIVNVEKVDNKTTQPDDNVENHALTIECTLLRQQIELLEAQIEDLKSEREAWRQDAENWHRVADQSQQLQLAQLKALPAPRIGLWAWIIGRKPDKED